MTPTQRSLALLRAAGMYAYVVERWNSFAKIRQDFGGFADILAWNSVAGVLAVQTTTRAHDDRQLALLAKDNVRAWLAGGNRLHIHGWAKVGARGKRKRWACKVVEVTDCPKIAHATAAKAPSVPCPPGAPCGRSPE